MKNYSKKAETFSNIYWTISVLVLVVISIFSFAFPLLVYSNEMLEDPKINKIYAIEQEYKDDYRKAIDLDEVTINIDEDINVTVKTSNYSLTTTYDSAGKYIETKVEPLLGGAMFIIAFFCFGLVTFGSYEIINFVYTLVYDKLKKKDDEINEVIKEQEREEFRKKIRSDLGIEKSKEALEE